MSQIEENEPIDEMLENTNLNYTYSPMVEQHGLLEEMFDVVSTPTNDAMGTPCMDGTPRREVCRIACAGVGLVPRVLSFSTKIGVIMD